MNDNKLIAEFMGFSYEKNIGYYDNEMLLSQCVYDLNGGNCFDELLFDKSWDWLKPVVRKCKNVDADWINDNAQHLIDDIDNALTCCWSEESTCKVVVEFIKEYNLKS